MGMTHPVSDTLLKYVLETLHKAEESAVSAHIVDCEACKRAVNEIRGDIRRLQSLGADIDVPAPPALPRQLHKALFFSRWAAVLAAGFLLGYFTSNITSAVPSIPVQQRLVPEWIVEDTLGFMPCQAVDAGVPVGSRR